MSVINRALVERAGLAASTAFTDAACITELDLRYAALDAAVRADDAAVAAIWAVGDRDPLFLEIVVADALEHAEEVITISALAFARRAAS